MSSKSYSMAQVLSENSTLGYPPSKTSVTYDGPWWLPDGDQHTEDEQDVEDEPGADDEEKLCTCRLTKATLADSTCDHPEGAYIHLPANEVSVVWSAQSRNEEFTNLLPETVRAINVTSRPSKEAASGHVYIIADLRKLMSAEIDLESLTRELKIDIETYVIENFAPTQSPVVSSAYITSLHHSRRTELTDSIGEHLRSWCQRAILEVTLEASKTVLAALQTEAFMYIKNDVVWSDPSCDKVPLLGPISEDLPVSASILPAGHNTNATASTSAAPQPNTRVNAMHADPSNGLSKGQAKRARREARNRALAMQPGYLGTVPPGSLPTPSRNPQTAARTAHPTAPVPPSVSSAPSAPSAQGGLQPAGPAQVSRTPHGLPARPTWTPGLGRGALPDNNTRSVATGNGQERTTSGTASNASNTSAVPNAPGPSRARLIKGDHTKAEQHRKQPTQRPSASGSSSRAPVPSHPAIKSDKDHKSVEDTKDAPRASTSTASGDDKGKKRAAPNPPATGPISSKRPKANNKGKGKAIEVVDLTGDSD